MTFDRAFTVTVTVMVMLVVKVMAVVLQAAPIADKPGAMLPGANA